MKTNKLWQHSIMLICLMIGGLFVSCDDDGIEKIAPPETMTKPLYDSKWESVGVSGTYKMDGFDKENSYPKMCDFYFYPKGTSYSYDWRDSYYYERSGNTITFTIYSSSIYDYEPCLTRAVLSDDNMTMALYGKEANYSWYEEKLLMTLSRE